MTLTPINPATGKALGTYPEATPDRIEQVLGAAEREAAPWRDTPLARRSELMNALATRLLEDRDAHARLMAEEMGKPVRQGRAEVEKCAATCRYYADHAERFLAPETVASDAGRSRVAFEPLGIVLAVMPWNFPFWQVFRAAVPALMAGNAMVVKHASNVPGCAAAIEAAFRAAGFPDGLFSSPPLAAARVPALIRDRRVRAVTLTGSTEAGRAVAAAAGAALKKTVLELGGSDPYLVLEDADLEAAAETCAAARLVNAGQSCIAAKRFIVVESVRPRFESLLVERLRARVVGDPLRDETDVGPLARAELRDELHAQVERTLALGARRLLGGEVPEGPGAFYPATVLTGVRPGMPAFDEETFGPVAAVVAARDEGEAVRLANASPFGLGAAVFTGDPARGERVAARIESGSVFVNDFVRSDPRLPFGGVKDSGYGRELSSFGIREFVNVKTIWEKSRPGAS